MLSVFYEVFYTIHLKNLKLGFGGGVMLHLPVEFYHNSKKFCFLKFHNILLCIIIICFTLDHACECCWGHKQTSLQCTPRPRYFFIKKEVQHHLDAKIKFIDF